MLHATVTTMGLKKPPPQSIAESWSKFGHQPADVRTIIFILLFAAIAYIVVSVARFLGRAG